MMKALARFQNGQGTTSLSSLLFIVYAVPDVTRACAGCAKCLHVIREVEGHEPLVPFHPQGLRGDQFVITG